MSHTTTTTILLLTVIVVAVTAVLAIFTILQEEAYATHNYCNTQQNSTYTSYYYREECYYYDYRERLIKYTLNEQSKDWSYGQSQSITSITETWSYHANDILQNHCYEYYYYTQWYYSGSAGNSTTNKKDCESYDSTGREIYREKVDEFKTDGCASYCYTHERKDNRKDYYYYYYSNTDSWDQHCYEIDNYNYRNTNTVSEYKYYLSECDRKSSWVEEHEGEPITVNAILTNGYERIEDYYSGSSGTDRNTWVKSWYDTQTKRIYTYMLRDWYYAYSGCCYGQGTIEFNPTNYTGKYPFDSLCYPYALVKQNYLIENGKPTGNNDGTFYRADKFEYRVKGIYLLRNDQEDPCYITSVSFSSMSPALTLEECYEYSPYGFCKWGKISISDNASYGIHTIEATAYYRVPSYRYWTTYEYCSNWSCSNEAPKSEYWYTDMSYPITLATADVKQYNPQFIVLPYLAIADPSDWSYEKQVVVVLHYLGNKDQDGNINEGQRVLINELEDKEHAYEVLKGYGLPNVDPSTVKKELVLDIRFRALSSNNCLDSTFIALDRDNDSYTDELLLLQEGYYAISLHYRGTNMQDIMLDLQNNQLADSTLQQRYYTKALTIAGYDTQQDKELFALEYVYPARQFYATVVVKSVKQSSTGGGLEPLPVYRIKITVQDYTGSLPLLGYLYAKYQYDILHRYGVNDQTLAYKPLCLENAQSTYTQAVYEQFNTAQGVAWVRLTSLLIGEKAKQALQVQDILEIPLQYALQAPTPYTVKVEIQPYPYGYSKENTYMLPAFQQYQQFVYYANNGFYIWTDKYAKRYGENLVIIMPRYFRLNELYLAYETPEGWVYEQIPVEQCRLGCTLSVGNGRANITAYDEWFGIALASFPAVMVEQPTNDPYIGWTMLAITVVVSFFIIAILKWLRRMQQ